MRYRRVLALGAAAIAVAAKPPTVMAPASKWQMDYAPSECRLLRTFGDDKDRTTVQLSRIEVDDVMELALAGPNIPTTDGDRTAVVGTTTVPKVPGMTAQGFASRSGTPGSIRFRPDIDLPKALRNDVAAGQPTVLDVAFAGRYAARIELGSMKGPLAALDRCMDDLLTGWGLDPAQQRQRNSAPVPVNDPATWFRAGDYPESLNRRGAGGIVVLRLVVNADGSLGRCMVAKAAGDKEFEDLTCRLLNERARFRAAIGADGQPIASIWIKRVNWQPGAPSMTVNG